MENDLTKRTDRKGSGRLLFDNWELIQEDNKVNLGITGSPLSLGLKFLRILKLVVLVFLLVFLMHLKVFYLLVKVMQFKKYLILKRVIIL